MLYVASLLSHIQEDYVQHCIPHLKWTNSQILLPLIIICIKGEIIGAQQQIQAAWSRWCILNKSGLFSKEIERRIILTQHNTSKIFVYRVARMGKILIHKNFIELKLLERSLFQTCFGLELPLIL